MPTPIELTLSSLVPTISFLPPELIALSTSLLAQSRTKAASLKPEEEIGRTYACCHIACERLKNTLALEIAKPTPPVKPRVYNKLHTYLDSALKTTATPKTPNKNRTEDKLQHESASRSTKKGASPQTTPTKDAITPSSRKRRVDAVAAWEHSEAEVPKFVMPLIRHICKSFGTPEAAPHVFAGASSVLQAQGREQPSTKRRRTPKKINDEERVSEESIPALIVTLFVAVSKKMYDSETATVLEDRAKAVRAARDYWTQNEKHLPFELQDDGDITLDIERFTDEALNRWMEMEWYQNVPSVEAAVSEDAEVTDDETSTPVRRLAKTPLRRKEKRGKRDMDDDNVSAAGLLPGLGTMFQPAIDWLSDERRADYIQWKNSILSELALLAQKA